MKRKKANVSDLYANGIKYFAFSRVTNTNTGEKGYKYILCDPLTDEQKEFLAQFKNVIISSATYKYAPEIKHDTVILMDKMIKGAVNNG